MRYDATKKPITLKHLLPLSDRIDTTCTKFHVIPSNTFHNAKWDLRSDRFDLSRVKWFLYFSDDAVCAIHHRITHALGDAGGDAKGTDCCHESCACAAQVCGAVASKYPNTITDQSGHHFALWTMGRSDRFNTVLTRNGTLSFNVRCSFS